MRFDSVDKLLEFLGAFIIMGYNVPFLNINSDMKKRGFTKHIHFYTWKLQFINENIQLIATDKKREYVIDIMKGLV